MFQSVQEKVNKNVFCVCVGRALLKPSKVLQMSLSRSNGLDFMTLSLLELCSRLSFVHEMN